MNMEQIKTISIENKDYPQLLKKIPDAPKTLFYRGELKANENCVAVVGARRCSSYGKAIAFDLAGDLGQAGLTVVSGLAPGIDTSAHQAVVERGKRTIAVLGTGLDEKILYPQQNLNLTRKIIETGGCLISEYPPATRGNTFTFPQRNRLISGLSLGIIVVEAKKKSGALITANWAKRQGRKVFAVPGSIHSLNSQGCHLAIKQGAKLIENSRDVLEELNLPILTCNSKHLSGENKEETLILEALKQGPLYIDKIIEAADLSPDKVAGNLSIMEIQGKIRNLGGSVFALSR